MDGIASMSSGGRAKGTAKMKRVKQDDKGSSLHFSLKYMVAAE